MTPYLPEIAGTLDVTPTNGFGRIDDANDSSLPNAARLFSVIDSDATAAGVFNTNALNTSNEMETAWTQSVLDNADRPNGDLATGAGRLQGLVEQGLTLEAKDRTVDDKLELSNGFDSKSTAYETMKGILQTGVKSVPLVGPWAEAGIDIAAPAGKDALIGTGGEGAQANPHGDYQPNSDMAAQYYQIAQQLQAHEGGLLPQRSDADPRLFTPDGQLRDYNEYVSKYGVSTAETQLTFVLNDYGGGHLTDAVQTFSGQFERGRQRVVVDE